MLRPFLGGGDRRLEWEHRESKPSVTCGPISNRAKQYHRHYSDPHERDPDTHASARRRARERHQGLAGDRVTEGQPERGCRRESLRRLARERAPDHGIERRRALLLR